MTGIRVLEAHIQNAEDHRGKDVSAFDVQMNLQHTVDPKYAHFYLELKINVQALDGGGKRLKLFCSMVIQFQFSLSDFDAYVTHEKNEATEVQSLLMSSMVAVAYSTARGIFYTRTLGTTMEGVILPIISPQDLLSGQASSKFFR